jgi:hypothetical protein
MQVVLIESGFVVPETAVMAQQTACRRRAEPSKFGTAVQQRCDLCCGLGWPL